jgi:hypothetical protein
LGCDFHENSFGGVFTLEPVFAWACALADHRCWTIARCTLAWTGKFDALLQQLRDDVNVTIFIPRDSAALALGADKVAAAVQRGSPAQAFSIVRNGRAACSVEPLLEVKTAQGRMLWPGEHWRYCIAV